MFDELIVVFDFEFVGEVLEVMLEIVCVGVMMIVVMYEMEFVKWVVD